MKRNQPTRRQFLGSAAAIGGMLGGCATTGTPAEGGKPVQTAQRQTQAPPQRRKLGPNDRIRTGFIGVGNRGSTLLKDTLTIENVDVVAITDAYDAWRNRAVQWCERDQPEVRGYLRFEEMLAEENLDAVVIATPDHIHVPAIMAALDQGLDVYTEKPMTLTWQDAKTVRDRVEETGAVLQVGTQLRSMGMYQQVRDAVQSGGIGELLEVHVNRHGNQGIHFRESPPTDANSSNVHWDIFLRDTKPYAFNLRRFFSWRLYQEYSNGVIGDLMVHHLDLCHFITGSGMPSRAMAVGGIYHYNDGRSCPDTVSVLYHYPENFQFNYTTTLGNNHYGLMERYLGTEGTIEVRGMGEASIWRKGVEKKVPSGGIRNTVHLANFFDCMRSREKPIAPVEAGLMGAACAHMGMVSLLEGESVKWDAEKEEAYI